MAMNGSGNRIVLSTCREQLEVWDAETGEFLRALPLDSVGDAVSISDSGHRIASVGIFGNYDGKHRWVRTYNLEDGRLPRSLARGRGLLRWERCFCMSPNGKSRMVSWSRPPSHSSSQGNTGVRSIWDGDTGELLDEVGINYVVASAVMSHDGKRIVSCSPSKKERPSGAPSWDSPYDMRIIDGDTREVLHAILDIHSEEVPAVCISPDGRHIVTCSCDTTIKMWDGITGELIRTLNGHSDEVTALCTVLYSGTGSEEDTCTDSSNSIAFSHIISASEDHTIKCWLASTGDVLWTIDTGKEGIMSLSADSQLKRIILAERDAIHVWDGQTRKLICTHEKQYGEDCFYQVRIDVSGRHFVSNSLTGIKLWDAQTGDLLRILRRNGALALDMNSSGSRIAWVDGDGEVAVVDNLLNAGIVCLPSPSDLLQLFNPDDPDSLSPIIAHFDSSPSLALEVVQKDGHRRNLLLAVIDRVLVSAEPEGQQPPSLAWVERLMEAYPLVSRCSLLVRILCMALTGDRCISFADRRDIVPLRLSCLTISRNIDALSPIR
jgi:WD40 repeat protein